MSFSLLSAFLSFGVLTAPILRSEVGPEAAPDSTVLSVEEDRSRSDTSSGGTSEADTSIRKIAVRRDVLPSRPSIAFVGAPRVWRTVSNSAVQAPTAPRIPVERTTPDSLRLFLRGTGDDHRSPPPA
jgi:hypothetical protein